MLISLCMIVRDEELVLERCLSSLNEYVDEIVIVDTGSRDDTPRIARTWADVYHEMEWQGMAACRNRSMDLASGRYLLIVDADEYADPGSDWGALRRHLTSPVWRGKIGGLSIRVRNRMMGGRAWENTAQVRCFYNTPAVRYEGAIHNQYREALHAYCNEAGKKIIKTDVALIHTGYDLTEEERRQKYAPRLKVMWAEYHSREGQRKALAGYHLACMLHSVQQHEEARALVPEIDFDHLGPLMRAQLANHMIVYALHDAKEAARPKEVEA